MIYKNPIHVTQRLFGEVYVNGQKINYEEWSVERAAFDEADSFSVSAPWTVGGTDILSSSSKVQTVLIQDKDIPLRIVLNQRELIDGIIDEPEWQFNIDGETISLPGRGKIGQMVDRQISRNVKNRTASSVASEIFSYHGIKAKVSSTSRKIGSYSDEAQSANTDMNDWELLNWLAEWEGFAVRVKGKVGFFGPLEEIPEISLPPISFTYGQDCEINKLSRHKSGAREFIVEGRSYYKGQTIVEYYPRAPKKETKTVRVKKTEEEMKADPTNGKTGRAKKKSTTKKEEKTVLNETAIIHRHALTGLSREQLRKRVRSIYTQLTKYDIEGEIFIPKYIPEAEVDRRIALYGVGLGLSQQYYITKVRYSESLDNGITTEITFANKAEVVK
jgi:phage protein D